MAGLVLQELNVTDALTYYRVLDRNRAHLSQHGDFQDEAWPCSKSRLQTHRRLDT
jgi:hypothetical protein